MSIYNVGDIVTLKSHPLFNEDETVLPKRIREFPSHVPPLMLIKEVLFEKRDKKVLYSDTIERAQIADLEKYICVFFDANKSEFVEKVIYQSLLVSYEKLKYFRKKTKEEDNLVSDIKLIPEVSTYNLVENYIYGAIVQFKTKKLEHRKSYDNFSEKIPGVSFQTPDFVLSGIKSEDQKGLFYNDGEPKRKITKVLFKVMWFNHYQQKFSEDYLPQEFFVKGLEI